MLTHTLLYPSEGILRLHLGGTPCMDCRSLLKAAWAPHKTEPEKEPTPCSSNSNLMRTHCLTGAFMKCSSSAKTFKFFFLTKAIPRPEFKFLVTHYWAREGGNEYEKKRYGPGNAYSLATFCRETSPQGDSRSWEFNVPNENTSSTF